MFSFLTGLAAGLSHVVSGPDHLAALAPFSSDRARRPWLLGVRWGLGHAGGVVIVGLLSIAFRGLLPIDYFSSFAERLVGVVLIAVGIWGIRRALTPHLHEHTHRHGETVHRHIHVHAPGEEPRPFLVTERGGWRRHWRVFGWRMRQRLTSDSPQNHDANEEWWLAEKGRPEVGASEGAHRHNHAAVAIGALHGVAGGGHFLGVLPAMAFPTATEGLWYLVAYATGTVAAMGLFSGAMGMLAQRFASQGLRAYRVWMMGCSGAAVVVGGCWLALSLTP